MEKIVLVTGGTGLVGSHLIFDLIKLGKNVRAIKRDNSNLDLIKSVFKDNHNLYQKIVWVTGDILDYYSIEEALKDVSLVYHCAAMISYVDADKHIMNNNNITGTENIVNACLDNKGIEKLCYVSSIAALGSADKNNNIDEESKWNPKQVKTNYSYSKYFSELEVWRGINEGLNTVIVNPSIILGAGKWNSGSSEIFNTVWKGLNYFTKGITGFVDVKDVSKIMIELMDSSINNEQFILNSENISYEKLFSLIAKSLNIKSPNKEAGKKTLSIAWKLEYLKSKLTGKKASITKETVNAAVRTTYYSNQKITNAINFHFIPLSDSIQNIGVAFLAQHKK